MLPEEHPPPNTAWHLTALRWWSKQDVWLLVAMAILPISLALSAALVLVGSGLAIAQTGWRPDRPFQRMLVMSSSLLVVTTIASGSHDGWFGVFNYLPFILAFALVSQVLSSSVRIHRFLLAIAGGSLGFSLLGLAQAIWGWHVNWVWLGGIIHIHLLPEHLPRPTSVFLSPNSLGIYLVLVLPISWGLWCDRDRQVGLPQWVTNLVPLAAIGLGLPLLVLSSSRNAWLVAVFVMAVGLAVQRCWRLLWALAVVLAIPIAAAADVWGTRRLVPQLIWQRLADSIQPDSSAYISMVTRWQGWQLAADMIAQKPLVGWGWQSFAHQWNSQVPPPPVYPLTHAHNIYLSLTAEGGVVGLMALLVIWGWTLWRGWNAWQWECRAGQSGHPILGVNLALVGFFVSGLLDAPIYDGRLNVVIWMMLAIANAYWLCLRQTDLSRDRHSNQTPPPSSRH